MSERCRVCSDPKGAKHYGSYCCNGCKGFFRRTLISQQGYKCRYSKNCEVTIEDRNCCPACRFDKCIAAGLDPYMIHDSRGLNIKTKLKNEKKQKELKKSKKDEQGCSSEFEIKNLSINETSSSKIEKYARQFIESGKKMYQVNTNPLGAMKLVKPFIKSNKSSIIEYYTNVEIVCDKFVDADSNHLFLPKNIFFTNINVLQALSEPRIICPRTKLNWTNKFLVTSDVLQQGWCRSFLNYIDWVSHIPELQQLTVNDQIRLVMDRGTSCMNILATYRAFQNNVPGIPFTGGAYLPRDECQQKHIDSDFCPMLIQCANFLYDEITVPLKEINLSAAEFSILRLIMLLTSVPGLSLHGKRIVKDANNFYRELLIHHIKQQEISFENRLSRIRDILQLLHVIEISSTYCDKGYSMMILFNIANMKGELPYEFHIRKGLKG